MNKSNIPSRCKSIRNWYSVKVGKHVYRNNFYISKFWKKVVFVPEYLCGIYFFKGIVSSVFQQLNNFIDFILKVDLKIQIVCVYHYFYLMNLWSQCNIVLNGFKKTANTEKKKRGNVINRKTEEISVMRQDFLKVFFECFPHSCK